MTFHTIRGTEGFVDRPLADIGVPAFDIIVARGAEGAAVGFELGGDAANVLGELLSTDEALELV